MNTGFSLVESLVIISIISILASLSLVALPAARSHQQLIADTELIQSLLLDSKERALNQVRPEGCRHEFSAEDPLRAACSDVGIHFGTAGEVTQFADLDESGTYATTDYKIVTHKLSSIVKNNDVQALVFKSMPPSVQTFKNGGVMEPSTKATIILGKGNGETRTLVISQFGTIDIQ